MDQVMHAGSWGQPGAVFVERRVAVNTTWTGVERRRAPTNSARAAIVDFNSNQTDLLLSAKEIAAHASDPIAAPVLNRRQIEQLTNEWQAKKIYVFLALAAVAWLANVFASK